MNSDPNTPLTSSEATTPEETTIIRVSSEDALAEPKTPGTDNQLTQETEALVDAIKKRAQAEIQGAGDLTRDAYLTAVLKAKEALEQNKLLDPERIEYSIWLTQKEAERNWQAILHEASTFGDRLADAAKAAWDALTAPRPSSDQSDEQL